MEEFVYLEDSSNKFCLELEDLNEQNEGPSDILMEDNIQEIGSETKEVSKSGSATSTTLCLTEQQEQQINKHSTQFEVIPANIKRTMQRICLVGTIVDNQESLKSAQSFNVPVITSETGSEFISDDSWSTYFVLNSFEGPIFEAIHKTKHKILGPSALKHASESLKGLPNNNRPIFNYAMGGVVTCFTGIRKKDELTRLVHLIHSMGGSIRKDMTSKVTHLICNVAGGEKYQYAMTFRLSVLRPNWVYDAWKNRDLDKFIAVGEHFELVHRLKAFEGQRVCFHGFAPDDADNMVKMLESYGGINTDILDPECSHVIMPDNGDIYSSRTMLHNSEHFVNNEVGCEIIQHKHESFLQRLENSENESGISFTSFDNQPLRNTSVLIKHNESCLLLNHIETKLDLNEKKEIDGAVLTKNEDNNFEAANEISPILKERHMISNVIYMKEEYNLFPNENLFDDGKGSTKRKRPDDESFDISMKSTESFATSTYGTSKKPKLIRTGSITKNLRRSMSFAAMKTPINNIFRLGFNTNDKNCSFTSINSNESTINDSFRAVKSKMLHIKNKISKLNKIGIGTPKKKNKIATEDLVRLNKVKKINSSKSLMLSVETPEKNKNDSCIMEFKTPIAPRQSTSISKSFSSNPTFQKSFNPNQTKSQTSSKDSSPSKTANSSHKKTNQSVQPNVSDHVQLTPSCMLNVFPVAELSPVVEEHIVQTHLETRSTKTHIVKAAWFWFTIQNGYAYEMEYLYKDYLESIANTPGSCNELGERRDSLINYSSKAHRKRKRLSRIAVDGTPIGSGKRRSSVSDAGLLSVSGSFIDCTVSPEKSECGKLAELESTVEIPMKKFSMRHNHFMDFYNTESNYVRILDTIVMLFKNPLEKIAEESPESALLNKSELKSIFSNFLPIYEVHKKMLNSLQVINTSWTEDCLIGQIILDNRDDLVKAYPPFVNFFEQMKETLVTCDQNNPRFHAFLKINQAKPECGRQSLQDLMIRPVQRLPSISLLLNDILKYTNKNSPDQKKLLDSLRAIKEVMTYINEDKRKTEGQRQMFDIFNEIECCPPSLISSNRSFISRCEVTELADIISGRGDALMLFLFTDTLLICKKRSRVFNNSKSPSTNATTTIATVSTLKTNSSSVKPYKHLKTVPLSQIRTLVDISNSPRTFALTHRLNVHQDISKDKMYSFSICDEDIEKSIYLRNFCKQMAEYACTTGSENFMIDVHSDEIGIDISDPSLGTLSKAFKFATRTRIKVGRAFSFNKTPSKLKRAVSTVMTESTNSLTPSSEMSKMKLHSCTNLTSLDADKMSSYYNTQNVVGQITINSRIGNNSKQETSINSKIVSELSLVQEK